jgi:predicted ATPase
MIGRITVGKALPPEVVEQIVTKTDGVPLFVEELTKMVLESGLLREGEERYELTGPLPPLAIPATLHDSLMARLDRLATVKDVAQLGATIGRTFAYELLQAVSPLDAATLQQGLRQLVEAELVYQRGGLPQATYTFKHALIQDAAYQSLLRSARQQYHQRIAQVLAEQFPETAETQPELLAHHYTEAGLIAPAISYWQRAGEHTIKRSAHMEAVGHFTKGLALLKTLADTSEHAQQELALQIALGAPLMALQGLSSPEVGKAYARARELCQQIRETSELIPVLVGLWRFYLSRGEHQTAHALAEQLFQLADSVQDPALLLEAHRPLGQTLFYMGEFAPACVYLNQAIALYDPQQHRSHVFRYGHDARVACLCHMIRALWCLGAPDDALQRGHEALTLAHELSHSQSLAFALFDTAMLHQFRREGPAVLERVEAVVTLSTEQGFPFWLAIATVLRGWVLAEREQAEVGIAQMHQGLSAYQAVGSELYRPYFLALLAEAYGKAGQAEHGLMALAEALAIVERTGERWWEAELHRLTGELLLAQAGGEKLSMEEAETCLQQALDIARRQQAKSLELRAAMSLSRLWQRWGKRAAAHQMLAEIYGWFTEGFDTADLQEARALLEELA